MKTNSIKEIQTRVILTVFAIFFLNGLQSFAQIKYKDVKDQYDVKSYKTLDIEEPISPTTSGILSAIIPGAGQIYAGEAGRGIPFFLGYVGTSAIMIYGVTSMSGFGSKGGGFFFIVGALTSTGIYVWNIVDAVKVAKIKNMAESGMEPNKISMTLNPSFHLNKSLTGIDFPSAGLSFKINF